MKKSNTRARIRDYLIYASVGLGVAAFALLYAIYSAQTAGSGELPLRWIGLGGATALTFWAALKPFRHHLRMPRVRWAVAAMLAIHFGVFVFVLMRVAHWPLLWFLPSSLFEGAVIIVVIDRVVRYAPPPHRRASHEHNK